MIIWIHDPALKLAYKLLKYHTFAKIHTSHYSVEEFIARVVPKLPAQTIPADSVFPANVDLSLVPSSIRKIKLQELSWGLARMNTYMELRYQVERIGDVAVVRSAGRMVRGVQLDGFRRRIEQLGSVRVLVLDVSELQQVDAGGLGTLLLIRRWSMQNSARLKLVNPPAFLRGLLEATHLRSIFEISSLEDAIYILQPSRCSPRLAAA